MSDFHFFQSNILTQNDTRLLFGTFTTLVSSPLNVKPYNNIR